MELCQLEYDLRITNGLIFDTRLSRKGECVQHYGNIVTPLLDF